MATGGRGAATLSDARPVPPGRRKTGYRKEIFDKKEDQDKFSCRYCDKILRDPVQADCGHRFCDNCKKTIEESIQAGKVELCKSCKDEGMSDEESKLIPNQMFPDRGIKREMSNILAKCPNEMCVVSQPFKEYIKHEETCKHQPLVCEKCGDYVSKLKMDQHKNRECPQRIDKCDHCRTEMPFADKKNHLKDCPKVPEACNQCSRQIARDKMANHLKRDCPNRMIACPLENCGPAQPQSRFQQHVQKDQIRHLSWVVSRVADLESSINDLTTSETSASASASAAPEEPTAAQSVEVLKRKLEQLESQLQEYIRQGAASRGVSVGGATGGVAGATGGASVACGGAEASASSSGGSTTERVTAMEFKVNSLEPILSVLHGEMNRCISAIEALEANLRRETLKMRENQQKVEQYETTIANLSATVSQREAKIHDMETRLMSLSQDKPDGTMLWKISNFSQIRQDATAGTVTNIHSRPFFTGPMGYKMTVRLYPNGDGMGKGTHMSLFFSIMRGPHDALLQWPFKQKVFFMLIDQNFKKHLIDAFRSEPTSTSFQRPVSEMNVATGCPMFVALNKLNQAGTAYLKDDTMFIRVVVEPEGLDEHLKQFDPRTVPLTGN